MNLGFKVYNLRHMRVLFTGGGTGGHFFPVIAIARELKRIAEENLILDLELYYLGPDNFGEEYLKAEDIVLIPVVSGKIRRYFSGHNFLDIFKIMVGAIQALWNFFLVMPDMVFSKGGYGALPAVVAAVIFRIPLFIHESDAVPGQVNRFSARFARRIGIAFESAASFFPADKTALVGVPIRKRVWGGVSAESARIAFGISPGQATIGFIGASQGSRKLNETVLGVLKELTEEFEILHQCGEKNFQDVRAESDVILERGRRECYHPFGFMDEKRLAELYQASDLIVSRAGASSIFEIAACNKPSILVPLSGSAQDHQRKNAYEYAANGSAVVMEEENLTPHILLTEIKKLMADQPLLKKMAEAAQKFAKVGAADVIAREILKLGTHS